jgi:hypothetical protein
MNNKRKMKKKKKTRYHCWFKDGGDNVMRNVEAERGPWLTSNRKTEISVYNHEELK